MTCPHKFEEKLDAVEVDGHCSLCSELELEVQKKRYDLLVDKANSLARFVEGLAYAPVAGYYEAKGNDAPLRLLRMAVDEVDALTNKGGAR
jgi:hypothetical protein